MSLFTYCFQMDNRAILIPLMYFKKAMCFTININIFIITEIAFFATIYTWDENINIR